MKKIVSSLLCISIAAAMGAGLAGCGSSNGGSSDTLVWYTFGDRPEDLDSVLAAANEIVEPAIGLKLDMQFIDSASYQEKMRLKMASGEPYDLAFTGYINNYQTAVSLGGLYDITDLIKEVGLDEIIPQFYFDSATVDGKIYGIPNVQVVSNPVCIMADESLAKEIGVDLFEKIQDTAQNAKNHEDIVKYASLLDELFEKAHTLRPDLYTYNPTYQLITVPRYEGLLGDTNILKDGSSDQLVNLSDTEDWLLNTDKFREWYLKGYIRNDIASKGTVLTGNDEERQIAIRASTWKPGQDSYIVTRYGEKPVYALIHKPYVGRTGPLATMTSVGANTKHPKEAVEFLKLINSNKELYNIICWGIEGKHYTKEENGHITEIEGSGYTGNGQNAWKYGNQFNGLLLHDQEDGIWEQTEEMNNSAMKSPMLGFVPDTDPIANELSNITNTQGEYAAKIKFGTEDKSSYLDEYYQKMDQAGTKKVLEELQKQYDEFLASK